MKYIVTLLLGCFAVSNLIAGEPDYVCQSDYETRIVKHKPKRQLNVKARQQINKLKGELLRRAKAAPEEVDYVVYTGGATINGLFDFGGNISGIYFSKSDSNFKELLAEDVVIAENGYIDFYKYDRVYRSYFYVETPAKRTRDAAERKAKKKKTKK